MDDKEELIPKKKKNNNNISHNSNTSTNSFILNIDEPIKIKNDKNIIERRKKRRQKVTKFCIGFCVINLLIYFVITNFYFKRYTTFYNMYNPVSENGDKLSLLYNHLIDNDLVSNGNGLYQYNNSYVFKGNVNNNYVLFNNMLWRIIKINDNGTVNIILDDYINLLPWSNNVSSFNNSEIYKYLNNYFLRNIDTNYLEKTDICLDTIDKLDNITCNNRNYDYVSLLDITSFLNSFNNDESYLVSDNDIFWLSNRSVDKVWNTFGKKLSLSDSKEFYHIRPVVRLKKLTTILNGNGTKDNPFVINTDMSIGSVVELDNDKWIIYDINDDNLMLMSYELIDKEYRYDKVFEYNKENEGSLAEYLNNEYYNDLSYKNLLIENNWYDGEYQNSIYDVLNTSALSYVGIPNILDIKFNHFSDNYYLSTNIDKYMITYGNYIKYSSPMVYRNIRPCIKISRNYNWKGDGTVNSPYKISL